MKVARFLLFLTASLIGSSHNSANARIVTNSSDALEYLERYGYMNRSSMEEMKDKSWKSQSRMMTESVRKFQMFAGVDQSGKMDKKTMDMMNAPRCGNKENMDMMKNADMTDDCIKRCPWEFIDLKYRIENFPLTGLSPDVIRQEIRKAFNLWESVANLTCTEVFPTDNTQQQEVDIEISFVTGPHNDNSPFSKQLTGAPVAHAYFPHLDDDSVHPELRGDIHFDSTRGWTIQAEDGIDFFQIATHEIGHSLGLEHSSDPHAVMQAIPSSHYDPDFALHLDDIQGITKLYGARIHKPGAATAGPAQQRHPVPRHHVHPPQPPSSHHDGRGQIDDGNRRGESEGRRPEIPQGEPPSILVMYHFQPLKYLWHCHLLSLLPTHELSALRCYQQVTHSLLHKQQSILQLFHSLQVTSN